MPPRQLNLQARSRAPIECEYSFHRNPRKRRKESAFSVQAIAPRQTGFQNQCEPKRRKDEPKQDHAEAHQAMLRYPCSSHPRHHLPPSNRVPPEILVLENWGMGKRRAYLPVESFLIREEGTRSRS